MSKRFWLTEAALGFAISLSILLIICPEVNAAEFSAEFGKDGLAALKFGENELLANDSIRITKVVVSDRFRDRNAEPDAEMYLTGDRTFSEVSTEVRRRSFDVENRVAVLELDWGRVSVKYEPRTHEEYVEGARLPDWLDIRVEVANNSDKVIELVQMTLLDLALPGEVKQGVVRSLAGWAVSNCNLGGPDLLRAEYDGGQVLWLSAQPNRPMRRRFQQRPNNTLEANIIAGDAKGGTEIFDGVWDCRPIKPGESDTYELSLRFAAPDADPYKLAADIYRAFGEAVPSTLNWLDRRPIAAVHVGDSNITPKNPRGWRHGIGLPADWDINAENSHQVFYEAAMKGAERIVSTCRQLGAQGIIVWQIEGMQFPNAAYYGEPRIVPHIAPEMDAAADDFFRKIREAGLRVGITIRPPIYFPRNADSKLVDWNEMTDLWGRNWVDSIPENLKQLYDEKETWSVVARLSNKIAYAKERWGCTLFYVDTNSIWRPRTRDAQDQGWASKMLPASVFKEVQRLHPDVLLIPEHEHLEYWAHGSTYQQPPGWGSPTGPDVRAAYPESFSVIATAEEKSITDNLDRYTQAVIDGDTFFGHGWYGGSLAMIRTVFEPAAAKAPYQIRVKNDTIELNGKQHADADALRAAIREHTMAAQGSTPSSRRAFVRYAADVPPERLQAVLDTIMQAGGIIAWTQPDN